MSKISLDVSNLLSFFSKALFEIKKIDDKQYFWVLRTINGETLCYSETFESKELAKNSIITCMKHAPCANILDKC